MKRNKQFMKRNKQKILFFLLALLLPAISQAQSGKITGHIRDLFTSQSIDSVKVSLLSQDGRVLATDSAFIQKVSQGFSVLGFEDLINKKDMASGTPFSITAPREGKYKLRFESEGYEIQQADVTATFTKRRNTFDVGDIYLQLRGQQLGEAEVKATKIKMYYKGDTLVYNASAFKMADGSTLEDLLKKLPGVEVKDGGIYSNGKFVESLLIGGKDFFKGTPTDVIKSLPAYTVDKLRVYEREGESSRTTGTDMDDKQLVMDLRLKREYVGSWTARLNAEAGTEKRYSATFMLMRTDDRQYFQLNGDFNNLNRLMELGEDFAAANMWGVGVKATKNLKGRYSFIPNDKVELKLESSYTHSGNDDTRTENVENFLETGNTFRLSDNMAFEKATNANASANLNLRPRKGQHYTLGYSFNYDYKHLTSASRQAFFTENPAKIVAQSPLDSAFSAQSSNIFGDILSYALMQEKLKNGYALKHKADAQAEIAFGGNLLTVTGNLEHNRNHDETFDHYLLNTPRPAAGEQQTDFRNRYYDDRGRDYKLNSSAQFDYKYRETEAANAILTPFYRFEQTYASSRSPLYRLDLLESWGIGTDHPLGSLPSMRAVAPQVIDNANSHYDTRRQTTQTAGLDWSHELRTKRGAWWRLKATLPLSWNDSRIDYQRNLQRYHTDREDLFFQPDIELRWRPVKDDRNGEKTTWTLTAGMKQGQPLLDLLLPITDSEDPKNISVGNADLKNSETYNTELRFERKWKKQASSFNASASYSTVRNATAMAQTVDKQTGTTTTRPENINGNYTLSGRIYYGGPLDKKQMFTYGLVFSPKLNHSADLATAAGVERSFRSTVDNLSLQGQAQISARWKEIFSLYSFISCSYNRATGSRPDFSGVSGMETMAAFYIYLDVIKNLSIAPTIVTYAPSRYQEEALNKNFTKLDLSLTYKVKKIEFTLSGYDILRQDRGRFVTINEQGRTEKVMNVLPSYFSLGFAYKFNYTPKKKM